MQFEILGISGKAGAGKDFISQHILQPLGYMQFSLAWHFKIWLVAKGHATYEEVFHIKPPHVRQMLQQEGTELGRHLYGDNVWCDAALAWMRLLAETNRISKFVIPDVRFPNELDFIRQHGGRVFRIHAPQRVADSPLTPEARLHPSETALDHLTPTDFDGIIQNDPEFAGTLDYQLHRLLRPNP